MNALRPAIAMTASAWVIAGAAGCSSGTAMSTTSGYAQSSVGRIAYDVRDGDDPSVVFVHGWSSDRSIWRAQWEGLDTGRRMVAIDLIGHGASDAPEIDYLMDALAESVIAVLDELRVARAVLVGHSNGVPVIRQVLRRHPERVSALVAVDGGFKPLMPEDVARQMMAPMYHDDYQQTLRQMMSMARPQGDLDQAELDRLVEVAVATPRHVLIGTLEAQFDDGIWTDDPIDVPLLMINAINPWMPTLTSEEYVGYVRSIAPRLEYHAWDDVSHLLMLERPERFNRSLESFLMKLDR